MTAIPHFIAILFIAQLSLVAGEASSRPLKVAGVERTSFIHGEENCVVDVQIVNQSTAPLFNIAVAIVISDKEKGPVAPPAQVQIKKIAGNSREKISCAFDSDLRPGPYLISVGIANQDGEIISSPFVADVFIAGRSPRRFPVILWGQPQWDDENQMKAFRSAFTHCRGISWDHKRSAEEFARDGEVKTQDQAWVKSILNRALKDGIGLYANLRPGLMQDVSGRDKFLRVDSMGRTIKGSQPCGLNANVQAYSRAVGAACARSYGHFPAFEMALLHSEVVDHAQPCFCSDCKKSLSEFTGGATPPPIGVEKAWGRDFRVDEIPAKSGTISIDHPLRRYYEWYWKNGHGWNILNSVVRSGLLSAGRDDFITWFDPAVRAPSIWGSGGSVDAILEWSYTHPDPLRVAIQCDELFAMAEGASRREKNERQRVFNMTQVIWYRNKTAPKNAEVAARAPWETEEPNADFITCAPDHLREAFWLSISRPIDGLGYHDWPALVRIEEKGKPHIYRYTHPGAIEALKDVMRDVIRPLGPALLEIGDRSCDVGYLESFTSQVLAGRGSAWVDKSRYSVLCYAQLQPRVIYEEGILRDGLDGLKILFAHDCDVLPDSVAERIRAFQRRGGILVADADLCPALIPDVILPPLKRTGKAESDRLLLLQAARDLRREIDSHYTRFVDSDNPDVITRARSDGLADYIFAINDRRIAGGYVGQYGLVLEQGVEADGNIIINRRGGVAYDLVANVRIDSISSGGSMVVPVHLGPGDGRLIMIVDSPIDHVRIEHPVDAVLGGKANVTIAVMSENDRPAAATIPVHVTIADPTGRIAESSGFYAASGGRLMLPIALARNDASGLWTIRVRELASGREAAAILPVREVVDPNPARGISP